MSEIEREKLYSLKELSAVTIFSESTWRRKVKGDEITHIRLGRRIYVRGDDYLDYLNLHTIKATALPTYL